MMAFHNTSQKEEGNEATASFTNPKMSYVVPNYATQPRTGRKAKYQPLTSLKSRKPTVTSPVQSAPSEKPRYTFKLSTDPYVAKSMKMTSEYLEKSQILENMSSLCQTLLAKPNLPYNPYPGFVRRLMQLQERFHMFGETSENITSKLGNEVQQTNTPHLWGVKGHLRMWGYKPIMQYADSKFFNQFNSFLEQLFPDALDNLGKEGYSGQVLKAVVGPSVFAGNLYKDLTRLNLRLEYLIYGPKIEECLEIFVINVLQDIKNLASGNQNHKFLFALCSKAENNAEIRSRWSHSKIQEKEEEFKEELMKTVKEKKIIKAVVVLELDPVLQKYSVGHHEYFLHVIKTQQKSDSEDSLISYSGEPFQTFFEGVFIQKFHAETYISTFMRTLKKEGKKRKESTRTNSGSTSNQDGDDFLNGIKEKIKQKFKLESAAKTDFLQCTSLTIFNILIEDSNVNVNKLVEIYRLLHSTVASFDSACHIIVMLIDMVHMFGINADVQDFIFKQIEKFKTLVAVLDPKFHERSSDHMTYFKSLNCQIKEVLEMEEWKLSREQGEVQEADETSPSKMVVRKLLGINLYCRTIAGGLFEDATYLMKEVHFANAMRAADHRVPQEFVKHGAEVSQILAQRFQFLNVEEAVKASKHPSVMSVEGVLMQYMVDIRLDLIWNNFMFDVVESDPLPPNPYPRLVSALRKASYKMELFSETDFMIIERLKNKVLTVVDKRVNLYTVPESKVFGVESALIMFDGIYFELLRDLLEPAFRCSPVKQKGQFTIFSGVAMAGHSPLYGKMIPYIFDVKLHHHVYVRGPKGETNEVLSIFANFVTEDIKMMTEDSFLLAGIYLSTKSTIRTINQLGGESEQLFETAAKEKRPVEPKMYKKTDGRFICTYKKYLLHYLYTDLADEVHEIFFEDSPECMYQYIFLSKDEAIEYLELHPPSSDTSKSSLDGSKKEVIGHLKERIKSEMDSWNMMSAYRLMLTACLVSQNFKVIPDVWRMLHSSASQLEYVLYLNRAMKELVSFCVSNPNRVESSTEQTPPDNTQRTSMQKRKKTVVQEPASEVTKKGMISQQNLIKQAEIYQMKLVDVLSIPTVYCPKPLMNSLKVKLIKTWEKKPPKMQLSISLSTETIIEFEEIHHMIKPLLDAVSADVHSICTSTMDWLESTP